MVYANRQPREFVIFAPRKNQYDLIFEIFNEKHHTHGFKLRHYRANQYRKNHHL